MLEQLEIYMRNKSKNTPLFDKMLLVFEGGFFFFASICAGIAFNNSNLLYAVIALFLVLLAILCIYIRHSIVPSVVNNAYFTIKDLEKKARFNDARTGILNYFSVIDEGAKILFYKNEELNILTLLDMGLGALTNTEEPFLKRLFGFDTSKEKWNIAVYIFDKESNKLRPYWRATGKRHPSYTQENISPIGRYLDIGEGHIGKAYKLEQTIVESDINDMKNLQPLRDKQSEDKNNYKSFIAVPIISPIEKDTNDTDPYIIGILAVTSNIAEKFDKKETKVVEKIANYIYIWSLFYGHDKLWDTYNNHYT